MACCSESHTITLSSEGNIYSFGRNTSGQLGLGHNEDVRLPTQIPNLPKIRTVSCGTQFTICVDFEGYLWSFGENDYGQLGIGNTKTQIIPTKIQQIPKVKSVSCGCYHTLIITKDLELWSFGRNSHAQLCLGSKGENETKPQKTLFSNIKLISAGTIFSIFQNINDEIYGVGYNVDGQLGLGFNSTVQIEVFQIQDQPPNIIDICAGYYHVLYLDNKGNVYSVGNNSFGELGIGTLKNVNKLVQIKNIPEIIKISCIGHSNYLLDKNGNVWSFGKNNWGQLGHGDSKFRNIPTKINLLKQIKDFSKGITGHHILLKHESGKIYGIGKNNEKQLGIENNVNSVNIPVELNEEYNPIWDTISSSLLHNNDGDVDDSYWDFLISESSVDFKEFEIKKIKILQSFIISVKDYMKNNNNLIYKQFFPPSNCFDCWFDVKKFLDEKLNQINCFLNEHYQQNNNNSSSFDHCKDLEDELSNIDLQIQKLQERKQEIEKKLYLSKKFSLTENSFDNLIQLNQMNLQNMCNDVSIFCENENQMNNEIFSLFKQKSFCDFNSNDICKLLWKMDFVKYQNLFEENKINGEFISLMIDEQPSFWVDNLGVSYRDCYFLSFYFKLMCCSGYIRSLSLDYDEDCFVCLHNTPDKTIHLLNEYDLNIDKDLILKLNYSAPMLTFGLPKDLQVDIFSEEGRKIIKELKKWRNAHEEHLKTLNNDE